jgi:hypothetical protein
MNEHAETERAPIALPGMGPKEPPAEVPDSPPVEPPRPPQEFPPDQTPPHRPPPGSPADPTNPPAVASARSGRRLQSVTIFNSSDTPCAGR